MSNADTPQPSKLHGLDRLGYCLIWLLGWVLAILPTACSESLCRGLGAGVWRFSSRRHTILSQLERAFPDRPYAWRCDIGQRHCARMLEMFLLIIVLRHWSEATIRKRFRIGSSLQDLLDQNASTRPIFFAIPHSALMESLTVIPLLARNCPPVITLYRPLDSKAAEVYVNEARERWGADLVARREGLLKAKNHLASGKGIVGVLFDQSPGEFGHLLLFFNRVCTATNLPGLLIAKARALPVFLHTRREGFWRGTIEGEALPESASAAETVVTINRALEDHLRKDDEACANWLWAHKRWKGPQQRGHALEFPRRKSYLKEQMRMLGLSELPRRTRILLRLDPRPELLPTARRLLRVVRSQRPDAVFWLLVPEGLAFGRFGQIEQVITLPAEPKNRQAEIKRIRSQSVDMLFSLDPSRSAVAENRAIKAQFSAGVVLPGSARAYTQSVESENEAYLKAPWKTWRCLLPNLGLPVEILDDIVAKRTKPAAPAPTDRDMP